MKPRLTGFLYAALLMAPCASTYADAPYNELTVSNVTYTLTPNSNGSYKATANIGAGGWLDAVGGTHVTINGDVSVDTTPIQDVTITMNESRNVGTLTAGSWGATPVSGNVKIDVTNGYVGGIYGGNWLSTDLVGSYTEASIDSITINLGGNAGAYWITGGSLISFEPNPPPTEDLIRKYATAGDIKIKISDEAYVTYIYGVYYNYEQAKGSSSIEIDGGDIDYAFANVYGTVGKDASVTINGGTTNTASAGYDGQVNGNATVTINGGETTYVYALAGGTVNKDATVTTNGGKVGTLYAVTGGTVKGDAAVTTNEGEVACIVGVGSGRVEGDVTIKTNGGNIGAIYGLNGGTICGSMAITTSGGHTTDVTGIYGGTLKKDLHVTTTGGAVDSLYGIHYGTVEGNAATTTTGGTIKTLCGLWDGIVYGNVAVTTNGGTIDNLTGTLGGYVGGDVTVTTTDGKLGGSTAVLGTYVAGNASYTIKGGTSGNVFGVYRGTVEGNATITLDGGEVEDIFAVCSDEYGTGDVKGDVAVRLLAGKVKGSVSGVSDDARAGSSTLYIGTADRAFTGTVKEISHFDHVVIAPGSSITTTGGNIFTIRSQHYSVTDRNLRSAIVKTSGDVAVDKPITLNLNVAKSLQSGRYMLVDATAGKVDKSNWTSEMITVNSAGKYGSGIHVDFDDLVWSGNTLYLYLLREDSQTLFSNNWGLFKSSQAFVNTLWSNHTNCTTIKRSSGIAEKGGITYRSTPTGRTLAWSTAYGQSARIGGIGADYSLYGGALGIEHHSPGGSKLGIAFGYDWGDISPFQYAKIDQETPHVALYGRAGEWNIGPNDSIAFDWSATAGKTTSKSIATSGEWKQKHMQLDARVSYLHKLNDKATASIFGGIQYFASEDAAVGNLGISSMQNLRTEIGAGITYTATPKTTLWAEVSMYNDAMRHNPYIFIEEREYHGTNPGRLGGRINIGAAYRLDDSWSLHSSYNFDAADDSKEHNINIGAGYQF